MRRATRKDANHAEVIRAFERLGCSVIDVSGTPCGFDIVVGYAGQSRLVEIKDGTKPPSARKLTTNEAKIHGRWTGGMSIVTDLEDVMRVANTLRKWHATLCAAVVK